MNQGETVRHLHIEARHVPALLARSKGHAAVLLATVGDATFTPSVEIVEARPGGKPRRMHLDVRVRPDMIATVATEPRALLQIVTRYAAQPEPEERPAPRAQLRADGWECGACGESQTGEAEDMARTYRLHVTGFAHVSRTG